MTEYINHFKAEKMRETIDPLTTLPEVELVPNGELMGRDIHGAMPYMIRTTRRNFYRRRKDIGLCHIVSNARTGERWFSNISLIKKHKGRGYGMATYALAVTTALEEGYSFRTQEPPCISEAAIKIWQGLADTGVADIVEPFGKTDPESRVYDVGHFTVEPAVKIRR